MTISKRLPLENPRNWNKTMHLFRGGGRNKVERVGTDHGDFRIIRQTGSYSGHTNWVGKCRTCGAERTLSVDAIKKNRHGTCEHLAAVDAAVSTG